MVFIAVFALWRENRRSVNRLMRLRKYQRNITHLKHILWHFLVFVAKYFCRHVKDKKLPSVLLKCLRPGLVVQKWVKISQGKFEISNSDIKAEKANSVLFFISTVWRLQWTKKYEKCFWTKDKEIRIKTEPQICANQPSNNWALGCKACSFLACCLLAGSY